MQEFIFSFFDNKGIKNKSVKIDISIDRAVTLIMGDKYKDEVNRLRSSVEKSTRKVIKDNLAYFTFSGTFKERKVDGLIQHSSLICIDFDDLPDPHFTKKRISSDQHTLLCFISPSGNGLKVIAKIAPDNHLQSFIYLDHYYKNNYNLDVDKSGKDVSRACFVSWDPDLYFNPQSIQVIASPAPEKLEEKKYIIDESSGEIQEVGEVPNNLKKDFDRAIQVTNRIWEGKIDITSEYDDWRDIAFSLKVFGEAGRPLFHKVSEFNPEYSVQDTDYKFNDALKTSRFTTPGKFFAIAKGYGISTKFIRTEQAAAAEGADGAVYEDYTFHLPDGCEISPELRTHCFTYGFIEHGARYHFADYNFSKREVSFSEASNFIITPLFLIMSKNDPKRIIEIQNIYGSSHVLDIPTKAFINPSLFNEFIESQGNFLMDLNKTQFMRIKSKLYDKTRNAIEIHTLGYHKDGFYAFANGIYVPCIGEEGKQAGKFIPTDDYGVIEQENKNYFIPALSSIYKNEEEDFEAQKKFIYLKRSLKYQEWSDTFCKVHKDNGRIGLMYIITCLFRDMIYARFKFFPHLFLFGPPGTGKSQLGWSASYMFGEAQAPFNLNGGTKVAFHKKFAMFRNAIVWFDEYNNNIDYARVQSLKAAYDGTGHEKSEMTAANRTKTTPVHSGCIISGQELPIADNALFKRTILLQYYQTEFSEVETKAHSDFREMEQKGLSHITAALSIFRSHVEENYFKNFESTLKEFKDELAHVGNIEERIIQNMVILVAMYKTLEGKLYFPFNYSDIKFLALQNIKNQNGLIANAKETNMFWDLVEFMIDKGERDGGIKDKIDYKFENKTVITLQEGNGATYEKTFTEGNKVVNKELLYIRLSKIQPLYMKYHKEQYGKIGMDRGSMVHYLSNTKGFIGHVKSTRFDNSNSSAMVFDYALLEESGVNMKRGWDTDPEATGKPEHLMKDIESKNNQESFF